MPGGGFVVGGAVGEASVEDADEAVGQGSQGLVVGSAGCPVPVVIGPRPGRGGQGGEGRPLIDGVGQAAVAGVAGQHNPFRSGGAGDGLIPE